MHRFLFHLSRIIFFVFSFNIHAQSAFVNWKYNATYLCKKVKKAETWHSLSATFYGNREMALNIARANHSETSQRLQVKQIVIIPSPSSGLFQMAPNDQEFLRIQAVCSGLLTKKKWKWENSISLGVLKGMYEAKRSQDATKSRGITEIPRIAASTTLWKSSEKQSKNWFFGGEGHWARYENLNATKLSPSWSYFAEVGHKKRASNNFSFSGLSLLFGKEGFSQVAPGPDIVRGQSRLGELRSTIWWIKSRVSFRWRFLECMPFFGYGFRGESQFDTPPLQTTSSISGVMLGTEFKIDVGKHFFAGIILRAFELKGNAPDFMPEKFSGVDSVLNFGFKF